MSPSYQLVVLMIITALLEVPGQSNVSSVNTEQTTPSAGQAAGISAGQCGDSKRMWQPCVPPCSMTCDNIYHTDDKPLCEVNTNTCTPGCICKPGFIPVSSENAICVKPIDCFALRKHKVVIRGKRECLKHEHQKGTLNNVYLCDDDNMCCPDVLGNPKCCKLSCPWPQYRCEKNCCWLGSYWFLVFFFIFFTLVAAGIIGCVIYDPLVEDLKIHDTQPFADTRKVISQILTCSDPPKTYSELDSDDSGQAAVQKPVTTPTENPPAAPTPPGKTNTPQKGQA